MTSLPRPAFLKATGCSAPKLLLLYTEQIFVTLCQTADFIRAFNVICLFFLFKGAPLIGLLFDSAQPSLLAGGFFIITGAVL